MERNNLSKQISDAGIVSLNMASDADYNLMVETFGGEAFMRTHTPQLYGLLQATREKHRREGGPQYKTVLQLTEAPEDFVDGIYIDHVIYDPERKCVLVKATVSLTEQAYCIDSLIEIRTEADEYVNAHTDVVYDTNYRTVEYIVEGVDIAQFSSQILVTTLQVTWQPTSEQTLRSQIVKRKVYSNMLPAVKQITVEDPRNINTQPGDKIVVVYGRTPAYSNKVDYTYRTLLGSSKLILDVKGNAELVGKYEFDKVLPKDFRLLLDCAHGCATYLGNITNAISATENGFAWSVPNNWNTRIPTPSGRYTDVALRLSMDFYCKGEVHPFDLYVASDLDDDLAGYPNYQKIPFLSILWGCLAYGSEIQMADGSIRHIEEIRIGEKVANPFGGGPATVINTWKGHEKLLRHIETRAGRHLDSSEDHPIWTEEGIKTAIKIAEGDRLLTAEGTYDEVSMEYPLAYDDEVFNLDLECEMCGEMQQAHSMLCNGLVVGDNQLQNQMPVPNDEPHADPITESLKREWELIAGQRSKSNKIQ